MNPIRKFRQRIRTKAYEAEVARGVVTRDAVLAAAGAVIILGSLTDWFTYIWMGERVSLSGLDLTFREMYFEILILFGIGMVLLLLPVTYHGRVRRVLPGDFIAGSLALGSILIPIEVAIRYRVHVSRLVGIETFNNLGGGFFLVLLGSGTVIISLLAHPPVGHRVIERREVKEGTPAAEEASAVADAHPGVAAGTGGEAPTPSPLEEARKP